MIDLTLVSQIKNDGDSIKIAAKIEGMLYSKAVMLVEQVQLKEAAKVLSEADPKPRVEKDHNGTPVVPSQGQYAEYFLAMAASHIKAQLVSARERWADAEAHAHKTNLEAESDKTANKLQAAKYAAAELKALGLEMDAATKALRSKETADYKKKVERNKNIHGVVNKLAHGLSHGSPLVGHIARAVATRVFNTGH